VDGVEIFPAKVPEGNSMLDRIKMEFVERLKGFIAAVLELDCSNAVESDIPGRIFQFSSPELSGSVPYSWNLGLDVPRVSGVLIESPLWREECLYRW
jgi:hypothetical protein